MFAQTSAKRVRTRGAVPFRSQPIRLGLCLLATFALGCGAEEGPRRVAVEGRVTLDGQPLKTGRITFIPVPPLQGPAAAGVIVDGAYTIPPKAGAIIGKQRVEIDADPDLGFPIDDEKAYAKAHYERRGRPLPPGPVPVQYNRRSTLTAEVQSAGANKFEFGLESSKTAGR